jgi:hypothetical protein
MSRRLESETVLRLLCFTKKGQGKVSAFALALLEVPPAIWLPTKMRHEANRRA